MRNAELAAIGLAGSLVSVCSLHLTTFLDLIKNDLSFNEISTDLVLQQESSLMLSSFRRPAADTECSSTHAEACRELTEDKRKKLNIFIITLISELGFIRL